MNWEVLYKEMCGCIADKNNMFDEKEKVAET